MWTIQWSRSPLMSSGSSKVRLCAGVFCFADRSGSRIFWSPEHNPLVLIVKAVPAAPSTADAFDLSKCEHLAGVLCCGGCEHVLFQDGLRHLQLTVTQGSVLDGPVCLRYLLSGFQDAEAKALALRRFCHLWRFRRFPKSLYPVERRAARWTMMARAWDAVNAGASQREAAAVLFGKRAATEDWEAGYRTRVQRLLRGAQRLVEGGYLSLLTRESEKNIRKSIAF